MPMADDALTLRPIRRDHTEVRGLHVKLSRLHERLNYIGNLSRFCGIERRRRTCRDAV